MTIVSAMRGVHESLAAAERLAERGIEAEVVDLRTIRPLDAETILGSIAKTNRLVVVEEGPLTGGWAGEVLAVAVERGLEHLDDAWRIATPDTPDPLQSTSRGRAPPGRGPHRLRDRATHRMTSRPSMSRRTSARACGRSARRSA